MRPIVRFSPFLAALALPCVTTAETLPLTLGGAISVDEWTPQSLTAASNPGFPAALSSSLPWPSAIPTANGGDAGLIKTANGPTGAPIPSGQSIYFVSFANGVNTLGGTLAASDATPVAGLATVALQIEIGGANGYDLWNNDLSQPPNLSTVKLHYTTTGGQTGTLQAASHALLDRFYTFAIPMPVGPNGEDLPVDIYNRLYGLQWDLSGVGPIASFSIEFSGAEHAQLYRLRIDQSSHAYGSTSVFPRDAVWTGAGSDTAWSTAGNWESRAVPGPGENLRLAAGSRLSLAQAVSAKSLAFTSPGAFLVEGAGAAGISLGSGFNSSSPAGTAHRVEVPLVLEKYNLFEVAAGNTVTLAGDISGPGFYKLGAGRLVLEGSNQYDGAAQAFLENGLIFNGGSITLRGTNTFSGTATNTFNIRPDTEVTLAGTTRPLDSKFIASLLGATSRLVLGAADGPVSQTFSGLSGAVANVPVAGSRIAGGSSAFSTLTVEVVEGTLEFAGDIGGSGLYENNLHLVKAGAGTQFVSGATTFTGDTRIRGGAIGVDPAGRAIELAGGVLILSSGDHAGTLGLAGTRFTADGGFAGHGAASTSSSDATAVRTVTFHGGAPVAWGSGDFVPNGSSLILSATGTNHTIALANPIDLGASERRVQVIDGLHNVDGRLTAALTGTGGLSKTGAGFLEMTGASTFTGTTRVHSGSLALTGAAGALAGNVAVEGGAFFRITNSAAVNVPDRLPSTAGVTLRGGTLAYTTAPAGTSETLGGLVIAAGGNTISSTQATAGSSGILTFATLARSAGAVVNFSGASVGLADARNQVRIQAPPALVNGLIGGWAVTANEFATYGDLGITAYTTYSTAAESQWTVADNVKLTAGAAPAGPMASLTADRAIHSLRLVGSTSGTLGNVVALGGHSLRIGSGGILTNGGADTRVSRIEGGALTAGVEGDAAPELVFISNGVAELSATIEDPGGTPLALVKSGSQVLVLSGNANHSGPTTVNQGVLRIGAAATLPSTPLVRVNTGGTLNVADLATPFIVGAGRVLAGSGTVTGAVSIKGALAPAASAGSTLTFNDALTLEPGSTLEIGLDPVGGGSLHGALRMTADVLAIGTGTKVRIAAAGTDFTAAYWRQARSFPVVTGAVFAADYGASRPLALDPASDGLGNGAWSIGYAAGTITLDWAPLTALQAWRKTRFGSADNSGDAADGADPDGDGLPNLLEYALGTAPKLAEPAARPALVTLADRAGLSLLVPEPVPEGVSYEVQFSTDLGEWDALATLAPGGSWTWHGEGEARITLVPEGAGTRVTIGDDFPFSANPGRFVRLKAAYPQTP